MAKRVKCKLNVSWHGQHFPIGSVLTVSESECARLVSLQAVDVLAIEAVREPSAVIPRRESNADASIIADVLGEHPGDLEGPRTRPGKRSKRSGNDSE